MLELHGIHDYFMFYLVLCAKLIVEQIMFCVQYKDGEMCVRHRILCKTSLYPTCIYGNYYV